jgi:hypothetical protein
MSYKISEKNTILYTKNNHNMSSLSSQKILLLIGVLLSGFILLSPRISYADNLFGEACGNIRCTGDQVCQTRYRGVLPVGRQNDGNATFTCVSPQRLEAPDSPYKGLQTSCSGVFDKAFGLDLSELTGDTLVNTIRSGLSTIRDGLGNAFQLDISGPIDFDSDGEFNWTIDPTNLIATDAEYFKDFVPQCDSAYNNIKGIINTNFLVAPLPVDIFNPLPLPVNITSPTPLPVIVVDDLALYQQKELIDAPLAAQQKAKTIATVSDTLRYQISNDDLIPDNYFALQMLGYQYGALDPNTGVVSKEAIDKYGSYQNFSLSKNQDLAQYFKDLQDQKSQLPIETFTQNCGNIKTEDAAKVSFECGILATQTNNNANSIAATIKRQAEEKSQAATELLDSEIRDGSGYFAKTNGGKNPFTKTIQSPGSNIANLTDKVLESTIDQAITSSGDNCFEAIPKNILDGSLKPVLTQGLFGVNSTLASVQANPTGVVTDPDRFANSLNPATGIIPNPNQFFTSLQDSLVNNVTAGLSCELTKQISGLLNGVIGPNVNIPGIGNVSQTLTNAATGALNSAVSGLIP